MKTVLAVLLVGLLVVGCENTEKKPDGYVINGTAKGVYNGIRVYLKVAGDRGTQIIKDTAMVMDEEFVFEGKVAYPQTWHLSIDNVPGVVPIMVENETITVDFDKTNVENSVVSGTKANEMLAEYTKGFQVLVDRRKALDPRTAATANASNPSLKAQTPSDYISINAEMERYPYKFLEAYPDNNFSLSLIENILKTQPTDLAPIDEAFENMDSAIRTSTYGTMVKDQIEQLRRRNERLAMLDVGNIAPNFSAPNPDGTQVALNDIKGKATIIDFWASWCGPCRRENPNVVRLYEKYHDKGLEIIGVSLDRPGQKDRWLKAIADDNLSWHHVSNLNYFNDPVAQLYNIQSIPATFILDADGKIVAKSLRGQQLEDKIAEMLD